MAIKRLHYFDHQFLIEADFTDEQKYHLEMRRRLNRTLHTFGIAEGLEVVKKTNKIVTVRTGVAIDRFGREMIVEPDRADLGDVDLSSITTAVPVFIIIAYDEKPTDPSTATGAPGDRRTLEEPKLLPVTTIPPTDGTVIRLARIDLTAGGNVPGNVNDIFDGGVRQAAGPRGERGLASLNNVSSPGGNIDLAQGPGILITTEQLTRRVTIAASGSQGLVSVNGVRSPGGNIDLVPAPGQAIVINPNDTANQITIGESHSTQTGNVHGLTGTNLQAIGALLANQYDLRQRFQAGIVLAQTPTGPVIAPGPRPVNVPFQPRFVLALGNINVVLNGIQYGGVTTGYFDAATGIQHGHGVAVTVRAVSGGITDWAIRGSEFGGICFGQFFDLVTPPAPRSAESLFLAITGTSPTGLTLQFDRSVQAGNVALNNFTIALFMLCMG